MCVSDFILEGGTLTPTTATPSDRKHHRNHSTGFIITGNPDTIRKNLGLYPLEGK